MIQERIHALWPPLAVLAFALVLVLQIPRSALFFDPVAVPTPKTESFASLVTFKPEAYANLLRQVRMSWQVRTSNATVERSVDTVELGDTAAPVVPLALDADFFRHQETVKPAELEMPSLLPQTLAIDETSVAAMPPTAQETSVRRVPLGELLEIPAMLMDVPVGVPAFMAVDTPFQDPINHTKRDK